MGKDFEEPRHAAQFAVISVLFFFLNLSWFFENLPISS